MKNVNNSTSENNYLIITQGTPDNKSVTANINKLLKIIFSLSQNTVLITYCDKNMINLDENCIYLVYPQKNPILRFITGQLSTVFLILKIVMQNKIDYVFFSFGEDLEILPILCVKLLNKRVILRSDGRPSLILKRYIKKFNPLKFFFFTIIEEINYRLADVLITESNFMLYDNNFIKYGNTNNGCLFVDLEKFKIEKRSNQRYFDIGYIGRFHPEKGINNFLACIPEIIKLKPDIRIFIGGDGELGKEIEFTIKKLNFPKNVFLNKWISFDEMSIYLNNIKLLVIPSVKEGLPNTLLEALACGTLVLATPVGGIPGVIQDRKRGFIMEDNTPECITKNIMRALNYPDHEKIIEDGREFIKTEHSYENSIKCFTAVICKCARR